MGNMTDEYSDKEQAQLRKLDQLRKLVQTILGHHILLLVIVFILILGAVLSSVLMVVLYSPSRYLARLNLCFQPKQKGKIGQYDDRYVLQILKRKSTRVSFYSQKDGKDPKRRQLARRIMFSVNRKQPHNFTILLHAASESDAVEYINDFAQICISEYIRERTLDLKKWKRVLEEERKGLNEKTQKLNAEMAKMTMPLNIISPEKDFERLRTQMNDLQSSRVRLNYVLKNLEQRKTQLEKELAAVNPKMLEYQFEIKKFFAELEKLDNEITLSGELYTPENPKMIALLSRRNAEQKRLALFLHSKGIGSADPQMLRLAEKLNTELKSVQQELEAKNGELRILEGEIEGCRNRFLALSQYRPRIQMLTQQRKNLQESMQRLDESISEINYMLLMVKEDLFIGEKASSAVGNQPFSKKKLAISIFAALALTAFVAALVVLLEFFFGKIADAKELMLYEDFHYLGVLPDAEKMFSSEDRERMIFNKIFHKFQAVGPHVIFTAALPGAKILNQLFDFFDWSFAVSGRKMLVIDMILAEEFEDMPDPDSNTVLITFSKGKCHLPLASKKYLSPTESEMLKSDFEILKKEFDYIFIRHSFTLRRSILLLEQIASLCDGALVAVGAGRTPRKSLRNLISTQLRINIPFMTILTDHQKKRLHKELNLEAES